MLLGTSLVAAFIAGVAALFAPCCITVLLPSYLASIFREKYKVFLMTFLFFLGVLTVFLPLGLGAAALGSLFQRYHNVIFSLGGVMLISLGLFMLLSKHISLPWHINPVLKKHNAISVYLLGIFSGIATTCCAPVLAGVLALSILPGSIFWGAIYTLSYVLGMVSPLFILSLFLDKFDFTKKLMRVRKPLMLKIFGQQIELAWSELVAGVIFVAMGGYIIYLALANRLFQHASYQTDINIYLTRLLNWLQNIVPAMPEIGWAILVVLALAALFYFSLRLLKKENYEKK